MCSFLRFARETRGGGRRHRGGAGGVKEDGRGQNPTEIEESPVFGVFSVGIGEKRKEEVAGGQKKGSKDDKDPFTLTTRSRCREDDTDEALD